MIYYLYASELGSGLWIHGFSSDRGDCYDDSVFVGTFECDLTLEEYNKKVAPSKIEMLETEAKEIMEQARLRCKQIEEQIANLRCLEHTDVCGHGSD